jgi:hypothetical protein
MTHDPYDGRDTRTRLISERSSFERVEPITRRALLALGLLAFGIGVAQLMSSPQPSARAFPLDRTRFPTDNSQ